MPGLFRKDEPPEEERQTLEGVVERVVYSHPESGWTVLRVSRTGKAGKLSVVGRLPGLKPPAQGDDRGLGANPAKRGQ